MTQLPAPDTTPEPRPLVRAFLFFTAMALVIIAIVGLTVFLIYNSLRAPRHEGKGVAADVTVTTFVKLDQADSFPVGLTTASDGTLYATLFGTGAILKVDQQGATTPWIDKKGGFSAPGWIATAPDNSVAVIDYTAPDPGEAIGRLKHISAKGDVDTRDATQLPLFAQPAFDDAGNLYVTNPQNGQVWRCQGNDQCVYTWWTGPKVGNARSQPTAITFDATRKAMLVADAGTGSIYAVGMDGSASKDSPMLIYRNSDKTIQAMALDSQDRVLFVTWHGDNGELYRIESDGGATLLADNFRAPTALVYRDNKVYVVNSDLLGISKPLFGVIPSPLQARPPFTIDVVTLPK